MKNKPLSRVLLDREDAQAILGPYHEKLVNISVTGYTDGWLGHKNVRPDVHHIFTPRTSATYIYDYTAYVARQQFAGDPGVEILHEETAWYFKFSDRLFVRFARLNAYGCPSSNDTNHGMIASNQWSLWQEDRTAPFYPTYVVVGHMLNPAGTEVTDVRAVCMRDEDKAWDYSISYATAATPQEIVWDGTADDSQPEAAVRVRKKHGSKEGN